MYSLANMKKYYFVCLKVSLLLFEKSLQKHVQMINRSWTEYIYDTGSSLGDDDTARNGAQRLVAGASGS